jgi:SAM-dependent methyltransferase
VSPTTGDLRAWYNRHYATQGTASMRPAQAYPPILDLLQPESGRTLLDVSCGTGHVLAAAAARGLRAIGVDLSDQAVRIARAAGPAALLAVCSGESLCLRAASVDYLTCLGSLEHFADMEAGLREMRRVVRPAARLVIMVPNRRFLGWWVLGRRGTAQEDINERLLTLEEWRALLEQAGFEELGVHPDPWHATRLRSASGAGPLARVGGWLVGQLWRWLPLRFDYQFVFVVRPRAAAAAA